MKYSYVRPMDLHNHAPNGECEYAGCVPVVVRTKADELQAEIERLKPIAHEAWLVALSCQFAPQIASQKLYDLCVDYGMSPLASDIPPETTGDSHSE